MEQPENYLRPATTKGQVNKYCRIAFDIDCVVKGVICKKWQGNGWKGALE